MRAGSQHINTTGEVSFWTDRSHIDTGWTGANVAWRDPRWRIRKTYLDTNKEVFDPDLYAVGELLRIALRDEGTDLS